MYKITKEMLDEFQRVMAIRPRLYHDFMVSKYQHLLNDDEHEFRDDANNDAANCLLLSRAAGLIYSGQGVFEPKTVGNLLNLDFEAVQELSESVAIYKGRGREKSIDWTLAIELNSNNFLEGYGFYNEENAPKVEAKAVLYTIEWYLQEAGLYEMPKWTYPEQEAEFMAQFKDFELI
jgi:hypothetical protein